MYRLAQPQNYTTQEVVLSRGIQTGTLRKQLEGIAW